MIDFLCQIEILLLNMLKLFKIPGFSRFFVQNSRFFSKFIKFQVFPGFQVKWQPCIYTKKSFLLKPESWKFFHSQRFDCSPVSANAFKIGNLFAVISNFKRCKLQSNNSTNNWENHNKMNKLCSFTCYA